jgi:hypothetical protein
MSDEICFDGSLLGVTGDLCSPSCTGTGTGTCPTDVSTGVTADPQCDFNNHGGKKFCGLICSPTSIIKDQKAADAQCGSSASCKRIGGLRLCTYDK